LAEPKLRTLGALTGASRMIGREGVGLGSRGAVIALGAW
jgi:hypothetical protein